MVTYLPFVLILAAEVTSHDVYRSPLKGPYGPHRREISFAGTGPKPPFPFVTGKSQPPSSPQSTAPTNVRPTTTETTSLFSFSPSPERIPPQHSNASFIYAPTGAAPVHSGIPRPAMNGTCQGATVNLVDASLDWWYTKTYTHIDSTFLIQFNNNHSATGWTLVPALSTLNITSAIANPTCISQTAYNMNTSETMLKYSCWDTPTPVAAATTTVEQTAYMSINATSAKGSIPSVAITPTPAALTIGNSTKSVSSGPPVVYFSKYEVVSKRPTRHWNGDMRCLETTQAHNLSRPLSFEYSGEDHVNGSVAAEDGVSGVIHFAVLRALGQDTASAGSFVASPTVVVVVKKVVAAATALAKGIQPSAGSLEVPTPTLPPGISIVSTTPTDTGIIWMPLTARVETSAAVLDVPTKGKIATTSGQKPSTSHRTGIVNIGVVSTTGAVKPADTKPTNAIQILSSALATFPSGVASAIASIIGAVPHSSSGDQQGSSGSNGGPDSNGSPGSSGGSNSDGSPGNPRNPVVVIGSSTLTATRVGADLVFGSQTASAGGPAITVSGTQVWVAPGAASIIIGEKTSWLPQTTQNPGAAANIPLITVGSQIFTANAATQYNIGGSVLAPGREIVFSGTTLSLGTDASQVAVDGKTQRLSPPIITPAPGLTIDGTVYKANSGSTYDINHQLLVPGGVIIVSGTTISLPVGASKVVLNGVTQQGDGARPDMATLTAPPMLMVDGQPFAPNGQSIYVISGQTLSPGGAITFEGKHGLETISLNSAANVLIVVSDGVTATSAIGLIGAAPSGAPIITIDGETYTAVSYDSGSGATYVVNGQTLTPGGSVTVTGPNGVETISLQSNGIVLLESYAGTTITSQVAAAYGVLPTHAPILTIGGETFSPINNGATYLIDKQTLTPGEMETVVIDGHTYIISLFPHATLLEIQYVGAGGKVTSTMFETLFPPTITQATVHSTVFPGPATASQRASPSQDSPSSTGSLLMSRASSSLAMEYFGIAMALASLMLAIWL